MKAALDDGRVLLTRDRALWERMPENLRHYVEALEPDQQLLEVLRRYDLVERVRSGAGFLSRCLQCNHVILPAKPHHVAHLVPGDILTRFDEFFFCSRCERVYWKGSHWERMLERVRSLISPA